jgi:monofunctional biosynthetic peptidoglycan transglycosylase
MNRFIALLILVLAVAWSGASVSLGAGDDMPDRLTLIDFSPTDATEWFIVNDGVMGGISESGIRITDRNTGMFAGLLSLENNGGFASVRGVVARRDLTAYAGLEIRVRGDGRTYQLRLRSDDRMDGVAYRAFFETSAETWTTARIAFTEFLPTFRGRMVRDAAPLDLSRIKQVSFLLADKAPGAFALEIDEVWAWTAEATP